MGRQSARIYFNGQDHKDMVIWDGSKYVYHDKAYIWNGSEFELVWEKLYGLKLLYESGLPFDPVSSENNKYIYFTENSVGSVIYRIKVNDKEPEREEHWTSDKYNFFSAPKSSRGFGIYAQANQYGSAYDYQILNLEDGTVYTSDHFDSSEYEIYTTGGIGPPTYSNQEVSPAESGMNHNYASMIGTYIRSYFSYVNYVLFIAPTGISAMNLNNTDSGGSNTWINGYAWDIGRLDDGGPRGLLPRFLQLTEDKTTFRILEYGYGNLYSATVSSTPPFTTNNHAEAYKVVRDGVLPVVDASNRLWFVKPQTDSIEYEDTGFDIPDYRTWDVSPDYKYVMTFQYTWDFGGDLKVYDIKTKKLIVNVNDEIHTTTNGGNFVGHKCIFVWARIVNGGAITNSYRLYKWR